MVSPLCRAGGFWRMVRRWTDDDKFCEEFGPKKPFKADLFMERLTEDRVDELCMIHKRWNEKYSVLV